MTHFHRLLQEELGRTTARIEFDSSAEEAKLIWNPETGVANWKAAEGNQSEASASGSAAVQEDVVHLIGAESEGSKNGEAVKQTKIRQEYIGMEKQPRRERPLG